MALRPLAQAAASRGWLSPAPARYAVTVARAAASAGDCGVGGGAACSAQAIAPVATGLSRGVCTRPAWAASAARAPTALLGARWGAWGALTPAGARGLRATPAGDGGGEGEAEAAAGAAAEAEGGEGFTVTDVDVADYGGYAAGVEGGGAGDAARVAWFVKKGIKGSTLKLNPLAMQIRGLSLNEAIAQMAFSPKRRAEVVRHTLRRAALKAEFYLGAEADSLMVHEAFVGKTIRAPRIRYHARGRAGRAHRNWSMLTVKLRPMTEAEAQAKNKRFDMPPGPPPSHIY